MGNAKLLGNKEIESAFVAADILDAAYNGTGQFDKAPLKNLRALGALYPETVQLITRADMGINSVRDLKGKTVSSGSPGSGQYQLLTDLLKVHGMSRADVKEDLSSFTQAVDKIKDGNLHATLITAGVPTAAVTDFSASARFFSLASTEKPTSARSGATSTSPSPETVSRRGRAVSCAAALVARVSATSATANR